jgi:hypothetical protein
VLKRHAIINRLASTRIDGHNTKGTVASAWSNAYDMQRLKVYFASKEPTKQICKSNAFSLDSLLTRHHDSGGVL